MVWGETCHDDVIKLVGFEEKMDMENYRNIV